MHTDSFLVPRAVHKPSEQKLTIEMIMEGQRGKCGNDFAFGEDAGGQFLLKSHPF